MTLSAFIKQLQKLEKAGHGRAKVTVNKPTFFDGNDTWNICEVHGAEFSLVGIVDGDGFHEHTQKGTERQSRNIVIYGGSKD